MTRDKKENAKDDDLMWGLGLEHEFFVVRENKADLESISPVGVFSTEQLIDITISKKKSGDGDVAPSCTT